jgi:long-subunit fatty acid transport protein
MFIRPNSYSHRYHLFFLPFVVVALSSLSIFCSFAMAQNDVPQKVVSASSPNPVGSGARAVGMGGAFIAVADDATAASWNPAGLTQLKKPEISFAYSYFKRRDDFSSRKHPETSGVQETTNNDLNYASFVYPFKLFDRNMTASLNYQLLYEFNRDIETSIFTKGIRSSDLPRLGEQKVKFRQTGGLKALSPAYAIDITPSFSLGITFNIWTDNLFWSNGWKSTETIETKAYRGGDFNSRGVLTKMTRSKDYDRYHDFSGFNTNIGFLWKINSLVTLGGVIKTPFTADIKHERVLTKTVKTLGPGGGIEKTKWRLDENVDLKMPLSYGLGLGLRFSDRFSMSLDVYRTQWDHFKLEDGKDNRYNAVTGKRTYESSSDATNQVRLGGEYLFIFTRTVIPVRGGVFYDPEPSEDNPDDFWGVSIGTGISMGDIIFDCAYQFRYGDDVEGDAIDAPSTSADVSQHLLLFSFIYHF